MSRSIILVGGPDSGKTNFVGRVWPALDAGTGRLYAARQPEDIRFVLDVADHLYSGNFAPRSEHADDRRDFEVVVAAQKGGDQTTIVIPDISGELWLNAAEHGEVATTLVMFWVIYLVLGWVWVFLMRRYARRGLDEVGDGPGIGGPTSPSDAEPAVLTY